MEAYIVRLKDGEKRAREIVGFFAAWSIEELCHMVDECAPVDSCEYLSIGTGGIYWERFTEYSVPRRVEPDWETLPAEWSVLPSSPTLTARWDDVMSADRSPPNELWEPLAWHPMVEEDDPAPTMPPLPPLQRRRLRR